MVPWRRRAHKQLTAMGRSYAAQAWLLLWLALTWLFMVVLPTVHLWPAHGLARPVVQALLLAGPVGALLSVPSGQPWHTLLAGLVGCALPVVACPPLWQGPASRPLAGVVVALTLAAAIDAASVLNSPPGLLRNMLRWPQFNRDRWLVVLAGLWLAVAWFAVSTDPGLAAVEWQRTARLVTALVAWSAVAGVSQRRHSTAESGDSLSALAMRRTAWLTLLGGLLWLWWIGGS